jgi:DNA end-binding protein Ku
VAAKRRKAKRRAAEPDREPQPAGKDAGPRSFWSGTITFGLVSVPVDLYPAVHSQRTPLRMIGPNDLLLQRRYFCSADGQALADDDIVRGYEWPDGSFTVVEDDELDAVAPRKSRDIDLRRFVAREEIPPQLLERPYVLAPAGDSTKAYHLLAATMEETRRAGIATFVMRGREYLAAIFAEGGVLHAATMRFVDELRTPESIGLPRVPKVTAEDRREVERALAGLVTDDLDRDALTDEHTTALLALAEKKRAAGRDVIEVAEEPAAEATGGADVIDIMSVLRQRLSGAPAPAKAEHDHARSQRKPAQRAPRSKAKQRARG